MFDWLKRKQPASPSKQEPVFGDDESVDLEIAELEAHLGNLVICVSNEIENVLVGYGKDITFVGQNKRPFLVVRDIVNDREVMPCGQIFAYTDQKFDGLNKLNPRERIAILYGRLSTEEVRKTVSPGTEIYSSRTWKQKVEMAITQWRESREPIPS